MIVGVDRDDGRVIVMAPEHLPIPMVREGGVWRSGVVTAEDLVENFNRASGDEAEALFQEAAKVFWADKDRFMAEKEAAKADYDEWKKKKPTEYSVYIDDNYPPFDSSGRVTGPTFSKAEEAVAECKRIVERSLRWERLQADDPDDPNELLERYNDFGDDPFIRVDGPTPQLFSAWEYAKEICLEIVEEDINDMELYDFG